MDDDLWIPDMSFIRPTYEKINIDRIVIKLSTTLSCLITNLPYLLANNQEIHGLL